MKNCLKFTFTAAAVLLLCCCGRVQAEEKEQADTKVEENVKSDVLATARSATESQKAEAKMSAGDSQKHTVADFIIHPVIAVKPRVLETESGKQADTSATTSSPWQFFPFNAGQGLSSWADWFGNRIQLPGFVDTPVQSTTTTAKPEVVIRIQQGPTRRPWRAIHNNNNRPYRRIQRPNQFNVNNNAQNYDSDEYDEDDDDNNEYMFNVRRGNRRRVQNKQQDVENESSNKETVGEKNEKTEATPAKQRPRNPNRKTMNNGRRYFNNMQRQRYQMLEEYDDFDDNEENDDDDKEVNEDFNYNQQRSQNELNYSQTGSKSLLNRIRELTSMASANEEDNFSRRIQPKAILLINPDAPEILQVDDVEDNEHVTKKRPPVKPKRKDQPIQYITIPWSQLDGSVNKNPALGKEDKKQNVELNKKTPILTVEAVPVSAEFEATTKKPNKKFPSRVTATKTKSKPNRMQEVVVDNDFDDDSEAQFIVIGDDLSERKLSREAFKEILSYFNQNRMTRQLDDARDFPIEEQVENISNDYALLEQEQEAKGL